MAILIVDDDPVQCRLLEAMLQKSGYETVVLDNGDAALTLLGGADGARIDCVILDLVMPNLDGLGVLARLRQASINVPVIVQTAHGGIDNVVSAMRAGAIDFVVKPVGVERLQVSLRNALNTSALEGELARIKHSRSGTLGFNDIITKTPVMAAVLRMAEKAATSTIPVLVVGRIRRRQGTDRARHPRLGRAARKAVHRGELRRHAGEPGRVRSCSATRRARSPAPPSAMSANSSRRRAAPCSSTRSANCRPRPRSSCCAPSRRARSSRSARASRSRSTCASSRPPIAT